MPFKEEFDDIYNLGILPACKGAGAYCERVDKQIFLESIVERVYNQIAKADIVVADMSDKNPNVFYETGYAHALGKRTILLTQRAEDIPFDLKHSPHVIYKNIMQLKGMLKKRVKYFLDHPESKELVTTEPLEYYVNGKNIEKTKDIFINLNDHRKSLGWTFRLDINNAGDAVWMSRKCVLVSSTLPRSVSPK